MSNNNTNNGRGLGERATEINAFYNERMRAQGETMPGEETETVLETRRCTKCGHTWERPQGVRDYYCPQCHCASWGKVRPVYHCRMCAHTWKPHRHPQRCPECHGTDFEIMEGV